MKAILAFLLSFILIQSQAFALRLNYPGAGGAVSGTYAGALYPNDSGIESGTPGGNNSMGLFAIGVPSTGLGSGIAIYFAEGLTYIGTIVGVFDPDELVMRATVKLQANRTTFTQDPNATPGGVTNLVTTVPAGFANGSMKANILQPSGNTAFHSTRLKGSAELQSQTFDPETGVSGPLVPLILVVDGFQQSFLSAGTVDLAVLSNTQPGT